MVLSGTHLPRANRCRLLPGLVLLVVAACSRPSEAVVSPTPSGTAKVPAFAAPPVSANLADYCADAAQHPILGDLAYRQVIQELNKLKGPAGSELAPQARARVAELRFELAQELLNLGQVDQVIGEVDGAIGTAQELGVSEKDLLPLRFFRAVANLRIGDYENCNNQQFPFICLIFVGPDGAYREQDHIKAAADDLTQLLALDPTDLRALWLLNVAHMLLGDWPAGVPEEFRISEQRFKSTHAAPRFTNVARDLGVDGLHLLGGSLLEDLDGDGHLDIFTTTYDPCKAVTYYHNDGRPDLFITRGGWQQEAGRMRPSLLRNNPDGSFTDVAVEAGFADAVYPTQTSAWADFDNDGYPDFYLATGDPNFASLMPNVMLWNDRGKGFVDVTESSATGHLPKGHGVAFGDIDHDGDQDIFLQAGGFYPGDVSPSALFENPGAGNHWLTVRLVGGEQNRSAIGARLEAVIEENGQERSVHSVVSGGASFGANSLQQELGLGQASRVKRLVVTWPTRGTRQEYQDIPLDSVIEIHEGEPTVKTLTPKPIRLYHIPGIRPETD